MMESNLATEPEIKKAYEDETTAATYVERRFVSELYRLLHERQVGAVQQAIGVVRPKWVLEIAPGPGRITRDVRSTARVVCLEYNKSMIRHGRLTSASQAEWVRGNAFHLPFERRFDLVYSFRFIRHFHREDRERLYTEIKRVLKPGGLFLMDAVNERCSRPLREAHPEEYPIYDVLYRRDHLLEELTQAQLVPISLLPVQKFHRWQSRSQILLGPRSSWLNRLAIRGLERLPRREGLEWVVTCRSE